MNNKDFEEKIKKISLNPVEKFKFEQINELIERIEKLRMSFIR